MVVAYVWSGIKGLSLLVCCLSEIVDLGVLVLEGSELGETSFAGLGCKASRIPYEA